MSTRDLTPFVVAVSGFVGSGKTTLVARLSQLLGDAPTLLFDDYEQFVEWPPDFDDWIAAGADSSEIQVPRLKEDLCSLIAGSPIIYPVGDRVVNPAGFILVEEPSGRERIEIAEHSDRVVFVDAPHDVCVARLVGRAMDMETWDVEGTYANELQEDLAGQLDGVARWITHYLRLRPMYIGVSDRVKQGADIVVDGMKPGEELAQEVLSAIERLLAPTLSGAG